jgi:hypothetical protein
MRPRPRTRPLARSPARPPALRPLCVRAWLRLEMRLLGCAAPARVCRLRARVAVWPTMRACLVWSVSVRMPSARFSRAEQLQLHGVPLRWESEGAHQRECVCAHMCGGMPWLPLFPPFDLSPSPARRPVQASVADMVTRGRRSLHQSLLGCVALTLAVGTVHKFSKVCA